MSDLIFRLYSLFHLYAKKLIGREMLSTNPKILWLDNHKLGIGIHASDAWLEFVNNSRIKPSELFCGFHYTGYIQEKGEWCLPSWIWTDAALVRMCVAMGNIEEAETLCCSLMQRQLDCGGWVVRNDYDSRGLIPMLAPNDSAYIANNAFLSLYEKNNDKKYLDVARKCADWIMETARDDGMVYTGYNMRDEKWKNDYIIVDVGFTAALFANLTRITEYEPYRDFLIKFINKYIDLFFDPERISFSTSIDGSDHRQGGFFGRGQAWALEGLIPAYCLLSDSRIKSTIQKTINNLVDKQNKDGSWPYNLNRKLMGNDCKGVSVIAKSIADWYSVTQDEHLLNVVKHAYDWCCRHTCVEGEARGGIFSFCTEGSVVKDLYSSCAFVYASAYAIELENFLKSNK